MSYLRPDDTAWRELPAVDAPVMLPDGIQMQCSDTSVLLATRGLAHVWLLDTSDRWQNVPPPEHSMAMEPLPLTESSLPSPGVVSFTYDVWTGREFFWWQPSRLLDNAGTVVFPWRGSCP